MTSSVAGQRKILNLARDYAKKREAFGDAIDNYSLHLQTLAQVKTKPYSCTCGVSYLFVLKKTVN